MLRDRKVFILESPIYISRIKESNHLTTPFSCVSSAPSLMLSWIQVISYSRCSSMESNSSLTQKLNTRKVFSFNLGVQQRLQPQQDFQATRTKSFFFPWFNPSEYEQSRVLVGLGLFGGLRIQLFDTRQIEYLLAKGNHHLLSVLYPPFLVFGIKKTLLLSRLGFSFNLQLNELNE